MGSALSIRTTTFDALIAVKPYVDPAPELGDAPYTVDVAVEVTRGAWSFGPGLVRLIYAGGAAKGPIADAAADPTTLRAGSSETFRVPFEHPAGVGIGEGARITVTDTTGKALATWRT